MEISFGWMSVSTTRTRTNGDEVPCGMRFVCPIVRNPILFCSARPKRSALMSRGAEPAQTYQMNGKQKDEEDKLINIVAAAATVDRRGPG